MIEHAEAEIPPHLHEETPLFLLATAGMRLLPTDQQTSVLRKVCQYFRDYTNFKVERPNSLGPCGSSVRIISGEEEGLFGWIAVNYLMDGFSTDSQDRQTYGFLDMGGASTQIAFEPDEDSQDLKIVRLRLLNGSDISHRVFVTTWLGYGTNQARQRYAGRLIDQVESPGGHKQGYITDPCLPRDLKRTEISKHADGSSDHGHSSHALVGSGNFTRCLEQTAPLLNKDSPCLDIPCLFGGQRVPKIDFSVSRFIGVSEYWYSSEQVFGLGGAYDFVQYERAANGFCMQEWATILKHHERLKKAGKLGGDGELEKDGKVIGLGVWGPDVELSRLELQCFKAAWIVNVLHEGLGMPRIVDPGGNSTDHKVAEQVGNSAKGKGLGKPTFQSADAVGDTAITWTLGKMVLEASKEIESSMGVEVPLMDPMQSLPDFDSVPVSRPGLLDQLSNQLPQSMNVRISGLPLLSLLFYSIFFSLVAFAALRMRKRLRALLRRMLRKTSLRRERDGDVMEMQDDGPVHYYESPTSNFSFASLFRNIRSFTLKLQTSRRTMHDGYYSDGSYNQNRTFLHHHRSSSKLVATMRVNGAYSESSRDSSPPRGWRTDQEDRTGPVAPRALYNSLSSLTKSQNSSSLSLYPRSTVTSLLSRSGAQTPAEGDS